MFGAGLGSLPELEHTAFGKDPDDRVRAERLDEALAIVTGLWSGAPFRYDGRHHTIAETLFLPRPSQVPRIPVWIGGRWPNRRPFRRAARWDGVFPTHRDVGFEDNMAPAILQEIVAYTRRGIPLHRHLHNTQRLFSRDEQFIRILDLRGKEIGGTIRPLTADYCSRCNADAFLLRPVG